VQRGRGETVKKVSEELEAMDSLARECRRTNKSEQHKKRARKGNSQAEECRGGTT
jgi:hypothetical protein